MPSKDLVTIDGAMTLLDGLGYLEHPERYELAFEQDPEAVQRAIEARDLAAESADDLFGDSEVIGAKAMIGKPFQLLSVELRTSTFDDGEGSLPFYCMLTVANLEGEKLLVSAGSRGVMRRAMLAASKGWLPRWVKITEETTANNNKVQALVSAEDQAPFEG